MANPHKYLNVKLLSTSVVGLCGAVFGYHFGQLTHKTTDQKLLALIGILVFTIFAVTFVNVLARAIRVQLQAHHFGAARASSIQLIVRLIGYLAILLMILDLLHIPLGKLLLGGALIGIVVGVAAQQSLGNFFASIVLITSRPFAVGQRIILNSGALGGRYEGTIKDIGLVYTSLLEDDGVVVKLPNATVLSGASIRAMKKTDQPAAGDTKIAESNAGKVAVPPGR